MVIKEALTFDDVQLVPAYSEVLSREDVDTKSQLTSNYLIDVPLVAAPMDTVCESRMAQSLFDVGAIGIIHRFMSIEEQCKMVSMLASSFDNRNAEWELLAAAIGVNGDSKERAVALLENRCNVLVIDVAHGHHIHVKNTMEWLTKLKNEYQFDIIAGSIATSKAAQDLQSWGADALRVGVGGGSVCETRIRTGIGIPQLQAVMDIVAVSSVPVISDGGIRYPGDVAKALAAGADSVMIGHLFSGTDEAPGEDFVAGQWPNTKHMKVYRGLASATTKLKYSGAASHVEGASKLVEARGTVVNIVSDIMEGVKSAMSYVGAKNLREFREKSKFVRITPSGLVEAHPHGLK